MGGSLHVTPPPGKVVITDLAIDSAQKNTESNFRHKKTASGAVENSLAVLSADLGCNY